jgi:uncharacterized protein YoxC
MSLLHTFHALQAAATAADTVIVRQVTPARTGFEQVVFVSSGFTTILTLVLLVVVIYAIAALRKQAEETKVRLDALLNELQPLAKNANAMVSETRETVKQANERVRSTVDGLADRVDDLADMIGRINRSAERVATIASTAIGGIKLGAKAFGFGKGGRKARREKVRDEERAERPRLRKRG